MKKTPLYFIALLLIFFTNSAISQSIVINEILTSNTTINKDEDGSYQDWIELKNNEATSVNLTGFGLTDDALLPYKWIFPNVSIGAGQYLLVWCSDKNRTNSTKPLHTNFKLSSDSETITLTNKSGVALNTTTTPAMLQNISYGRIPNGTGDFKFFSTVTPEAANGSVAFTEALSPPTFSRDSGFLTSGFDLMLSTTTTDATILYTLDGSEPQLSNLGGTTYSYKNQYPERPGDATGPLLTKNYTTLQYSTPIAIVDRTSQENKIASISSTYSFNPTYIPTSPIFKGTVVRAKLVKPESLDSKTVTNTYFISPQGAKRFSLPIVSLSLDEDKLFDYDKGIYVAGVDFDNWREANPTSDPAWKENICNYWRRGIENEKVANMTYFIDGLPVLNTDIGIRIHGGGSRGLQSKSLNLYARSEYGTKSLDYKFFNNKTDDKFESLVLRNAGNDFKGSLFRDALAQRLIKSLNCITESYQPTVSFVNGEFWGILNIRERYDDDYFKRTFNIDQTELDYLEDQGKSYNASYGDHIDYQNMISYITKNSLANDTNYNYIKTRLDPDSFSDYYISNVYLQNSDWPGTNIQFWRKRTTGYLPNAPYGNDGRWRWAFHDLDTTFGFTYSDVTYNTLALATAANGPVYPNPAWSTLILRKLLENSCYKNDFINRFADLMNTTFLPSRLLSMIDEMKGVIYPTLPEHISRWKSPAKKSDFDWFINWEKKFAVERPAAQRDHIRSQFGITSNINATLNVSNSNDGYIKINTIEVKAGTDGITSNPYPWTGIYFSSIPVKLKAIAYPGFVFSKWTGASDSTNPEITVTSETSFNVTAVFVPEAVASSQPIYYWMMNSTIANNIPLETLTASYKTGTADAVIQHQSCLVGYPFVSTDVVNWRKASMERRNSPTDINYIPIVNNNLPFTTSDMKGLQIKEPLQSGSLENNLIFNISTVGQKDIKISFAAINELTNATAIIVDYSVNEGTPVWITSGLTSSSFPLTNAYQLFNINFATITAANNNADFKIRLRFSGTNMTADTGARITFNNIAVYGTQITLSMVSNTALEFSVYPNPFSDNINIVGMNQSENAIYNLFTIDGKLIKKGRLEENNQIHLNDVSKGLYLLQLTSNGKTETKKIIKK
ncbi:CotH kinase family protein [Flavobacterium luteum]|uniref:T9SS type A sorting domain-containing protein n=1 Tax=Flavobacterium luteum TaxID=2026654 RepID=A0A7J5AHI2_9FLAO|nr:CotH kinase family protein [Flavobacterium luteum]KAB1157061.1 T9SS type A sorting domain-containing protein [Flavobacterium luteum]